MSYINRNWANPRLVGYMESHDEQRLMYKNLTSGKSNGDYNVKDLNTALSREETAGLFFLTIPGPKMIWQFGELGYEIDINENGRTSRKPVLWEYENNPNRKHIYNTWATLIEFKKQQPVFNTTDFTLNVGNILTKSIVLRDTSMDVVIIGNFDIETKDVATEFTKTGTWYEYFTGEIKEVSNTSEAISLNPGEYKMYSTVRLLDPRGGTATDDSDNDGVVDTDDLCPNTIEGIAVNSTGCPIFTLPFDNFTIETIGETCLDKNNGKIIIKAQKNYNYSTIINGVTYNFTSDTEIEDLTPGTYDFCILVEGEAYEQCYSITIEQGKSIAGKASVVSNKVSIDITQGTAPFDVFVNGNLVLQTKAPSFLIDVNHGDLVQVKSDVACEGTFSKNIDLFESIVAYPNPTKGSFEITLPTSQKQVIVEIYNMQSQLISNKTYPVNFGKVQLDIQEKPTGVYFAKIQLNKPVVIKIIKQ
jgi:hypothetical protein